MDPISAFFTSLPYEGLGLGALVTFMVFSLLRGWVVPRSVLTDRISDKDRQIADLVKERDDWKHAHDISEQGRAKLKEQNGELISGAQTTNRLMESMRNYLERSNPQRQIEGG